jgi:membrane protease YdiL (CAAX protease family)
VSPLENTHKAEVAPLEIEPIEPQALPIFPADTPLVVAPITPLPVMKCPHCFRKIGLGKKFCPSCGLSREALAIYAVDQHEIVKTSKEANHTWLGLKQMVTFYVLLLVFNFIAVYLIPVEDSWGLLSVDMVIIGLCHVWLHKTPIAMAKWFKWGRLSLPILMILPLASILTVGIAIGNNHLAMWFLGLQELFENARGIEGLLETQFPLWVLIVSICVVPGIFEEIFFRGLVMGALETALSAREAWIVQAIIFAIAHLNVLGFFTYLVIMGLWLGWLRNRSGSLIPGMIAHFTHNLIVVLCETYEWFP